MFITQISVYLENSKGILRSMTKALAKSQIDMLALSIADTKEFGIARIIVREKDLNPAIEALRDGGLMAKTSDVLCIAVPNEPAGLDRVLVIIEKADISIEYLYSLNYIIDEQAIMVLRLQTDAMKKADIVELLNDNNVKMIGQEEINKL